jgi:hypothetical protein
MKTKALSKDDFFELVPARQFFSRYAPNVKRFYQKMRGIDGNGKPIDFSPQDKEDIKAGIKLMSKDLKRARI